MKSETQKVTAKPVYLGAMLHYTLPKDEAAERNALRVSAAHLHSGHKLEAGEVVPLLVTALGKDGKFNGQAFLDGNDSLWVKNCTIGDDEGQCSWPKE